MPLLAHNQTLIPCSEKFFGKIFHHDKATARVFVGNSTVSLRSIRDHLRAMDSSPKKEKYSRFFKVFNPSQKKLHTFYAMIKLNVRRGYREKLHQVESHTSERHSEKINIK